MNPEIGFGKAMPMTPELGSSLDALTELARQKQARITFTLEPHLISVYADETAHTQDHFVECKVTDNYGLLEKASQEIINKDLPIILAPGYRERDYLEMAEWFAENGVWVIIPDVRHETNQHLANKKAILGELENEEHKDRQTAYELGGAPVVAVRDYISKKYGIEQTKRIPIVAVSLGADNALRGISMNPEGMGDLYAIAPFLGKENFKKPDLNDIYAIAPYLRNRGYEDTPPGPLSVMGKFISVGPRNVAYRFTPEQFAGLMDDTSSSLKSLSDLYRGVFHICARAALASDTKGALKAHIDRGNSVHIITSSKDNLAPTDVISSNLTGVAVSINESSTSYHPSVNSFEGREVIMGAIKNAVKENQKIKDLALSA